MKKPWCSPTGGAEVGAAMDAVLALAAEPDAPKRPQVKFDEARKQLLAEPRARVSARPGQVARDDAASQPHGVANRLMFVEPQAGWRQRAVTAQHPQLDFAHQLTWLVAERDPPADLGRVTRDHLNPHQPASLDAAVTPQEARRMVKKLEFHDTPKHGSWLTMAEIEWSI